VPESRLLHDKRGMGLHRYCVLLAVLAFLMVLAGALVTSRDAGMAVPGWPSPSGGPSPTTERLVLQQVHRTLGMLLGTLTLVLLVWVVRAGSPRWMRWLSLGAFLLVLFQGSLGGLAVLCGLPQSVSILHASAAQLFFALSAALAAVTAPSWQGESLGLEDMGFPPLRVFASAVPLVVLAQAALGAAYRHGALGLMPHVLGALVVAGLVLLVATIVLTQYSECRALAKPAKRLLIIALHQVVLGVLAYVARIITDEAVRSSPLVVFATVAHVALGALTIGASVILAVQVWRHLHSPAPETAR